MKTARKNTYEETTGIRFAQITEQGFSLNGKPLKLWASTATSNIHISGWPPPMRRSAGSTPAQKHGDQCGAALALPAIPRVPRRVRPAGLILIERCQAGSSARAAFFRKRLLQNIRDMIRRDRNHPSVMVFEVSPNETPTFFARRVRPLFPPPEPCGEGGTASCITSGDTAGRNDVEKVGYDLPYTGDDAKSKRRVPFGGKRPTLTRGIWDWAFGGNHSSSRVARGDGEWAMQVQAWNFQWDHNNNGRNHHLPAIWSGRHRP